MIQFRRSCGLMGGVPAAPEPKMEEWNLEYETGRGSLGIHE